MYLAIVMNLYSRRIIGWSIHKRMTVDLVERAMRINLNIYHLTRCGMKENIEADIRYQNRLHTSNGNYSPIEFEQSTINVSYVA